MTTERRPHCFVIMPITTHEPGKYRDDEDHFRNVYRELFVPAIEAAGFEPVDPATTGGEVIHSRLISWLDTAEMVLCDLSTLNPNVLFELGVRTSIGKPVALVAETHTDTGRIFDLQPNHMETYNPDLSVHIVRQEILNLTAHISLVNDSSAGKNQMWETFGIQAKASLDTSGDPNSLILEQLSSLLTQVGLLTRRMESTEQPSQPLFDVDSVRAYLEWILKPRGIDVVSVLSVGSGYILDIRTSGASTSELIAFLRQILDDLSRRTGRAINVALKTGNTSQAWRVAPS